MILSRRRVPIFTAKRRLILKQKKRCFELRSQRRSLKSLLITIAKTLTKDWKQVATTVGAITS